MIQMLRLSRMGNDFIIFDWSSSHKCSVVKASGPSLSVIGWDKVQTFFANLFHLTQPIKASFAPMKEKFPCWREGWFQSQPCLCLFTVTFMIKHTEYSAHSPIETGVILTNKLAVLELHLFFLLLQSHLKWDCCTKVSTTCTSSSSLTVIKAQSVKLSFTGADWSPYFTAASN